MSRHTIARLPPKVLHIFNVYERASNALQPYGKSVGVNNLIHHNSPFFHNLSRQKLMHNSSQIAQIDVNDFPPLVSHLIKPIFTHKLQKTLVEQLSTDEIFRNLDNTRHTIDSQYTSTKKLYTDFQARILKSLASYYSPLTSIPKVPSIANSHRWFSNTLKSAPIILVLKQKHRLFSHSSLNQVNKPLADLRRHIRQLQTLAVKNQHVPISRFNTFHLFDIPTPDIFSLALRSTNSPAYIHTFLNTAQDVRILPDNQNDLNIIQQQYPIQHIYQELLDGADASAIFPYDIEYSDLFGLTIEAPMVPHFDDALINILEKHSHEFEIAVCRLSLENPSVADFFADMSAKPATSNYDEMLQMAQKKPSNSNISVLAEYLGQHELTKVEQDEKCIYLVKH